MPVHCKSTGPTKLTGRADRLGNADVGLDPDDNARERRLELGDALADFWGAVAAVISLRRCATEGFGSYSMEKSVLSECATVLTPPGASNPSSGHVGPKRALFCVVANTGMLRIWPGGLRQCALQQGVSQSVHACNVARGSCVGMVTYSL